ncbi:MAG: NAD(P)/FAD-dependent oxidoreductase [Pseudomonadota bacterium]
MANVARVHGTDEEIRNALECAHVPTLVACLVHLTGDLDLLRNTERPVNDFFGDVQGGISEAEQARLRDRAFEALTRYRDSGVLPPAPSPATVSEMVNYLTGEELSADYAAFLHAELDLDEQDSYRTRGLEDLDPVVKQNFTVAIIGAGMSGLLAALRLRQAGIAFVIFEKHQDVGGTWLQNVYPGCRVDSANQIYSYSFKPRDWPQHYSTQPVLQAYFSEIAKEHDLRRHIRFGCEVSRLEWHEDAAVWELSYTGPDGSPSQLRADAVISAVGQLNRPQWPELSGVEPRNDAFSGPSFHSTEWEHEHDLEGKRIAVIGTGASAFQFVPHIARTAKEVRVYQRTANWMAPVPEYMQDIPEGQHWLLNNVPFYHRWYRFAVFWRSAEGMLGAVSRDPEWQGDLQTSISAKNDELRQILTEHIEECVGNDAELRAKCVPAYPPGGKRILFDDGTWLRTLKRDNVLLDVDPIAAVEADGVRMQSGALHECDVLIYGTGFKASKFLWPMEVIGRNGRSLQEEWQGDPRAYLGITIPGYPNLFCTYGPNTNIVVNGSIIFFSECEVRYIVGCLRMLIERDARSLEPRRTVHDAYNAEVDAANANMAWGISKANTWYRNEAGRVTQNWPFALIDFWQRTLDPDPADFEFVA